MHDTESDYPVIVAVAPNGARKLKEDHPAVPLTPEEIGATAKACLDAGAAMIHLHVRDAEGTHSLDPGLYREAIAAVRAAAGPDLIVQVTSEAVGIYAPDQQMAMVRDLEPEAVSLAVKEICPDASAESDCRDFLAWLSEAGIAPQYILYSEEEVRRFADLRRRGVVPGERPFVLYVLGRYSAGQRSDPTDLLPFLRAAEEAPPVHWSVCAFGAKEAACALTAAALGGHVRIGFENNLYLADGTVAPDNAALVAQAVGAVRFAGRRVSDPRAARARLDLPAG